MPVRSRRARSRSAGSWPSTLTSPASARRWPSRISSRVVLPAPLGPSRASSSPRRSGQVDAVERLDGAVGLAHAGGADRRRRGAGPRQRTAAAASREFVSMPQSIGPRRPSRHRRAGRTCASTPGGGGSTRAAMTPAARGRLTVSAWSPRPSPPVALRAFGLSSRSSWCSSRSSFSEPRPALAGEGLADHGRRCVAFVGGLVAEPAVGRRSPTARGSPASRLVGAASVALTALQPDGGGYAGVYFVVVVAAARLPRRPGAGRQRRDARRRDRRARAHARRRRGAHQRPAVLRPAVVLRHAAAARAAASAATAPRRSSRSSRSRARRRCRRRRWPSAAGWRATCTTCSPTRCRRWRCSSRAPGCWPRTATPTPRSWPRSSARTTSRRRARGGAGRDRRAARRRDAGPGAPARARRRLRRPLRADRHRRAAAARAPRRGWRSTAPRRRRSRTSSATAPPTASSCGSPTSPTACGSPSRTAAPACPCPAGPSPGGGYGITGMRERAELLGGRLDAGPTPRGFRVELWLPA